MFESKLYVFHIFLMAVCVCLLTPFALCNEEGDASISDEGESKDFDVKYETPKFPTNAYAFEHLDDKSKFSWVKSKAKKDDVDENISKYDGIWEVESTEKNALKGDFGLVLKSKAKHSAIAFKLKKPFAFKEKSLVVQYEVHLQNGQECGGAYIKLLSASKGAIDLKNFNDKTPYTIMFGPDKCGNDYKLHFIFRHVNPLNKNIEEKHCKKPNIKLDEILNDKQPHLYTLIVRPDNSFEISVDHQIVNSGNLLEDFTPPVNPPKEIDDPEDVKPEDWDERERIPDPSAVKPEDWDEDAPMKLVDKDAKMPSGWLEEEPQYIHDPTSEKPDDWDNEMDGEWEAPLIPNPKCEGAPGCGQWVQPMIDNPNYKGKWRAPMINNPNYQGKWSPRKIPNPGYFEDLEPFKMTPIGAVGIELWSMSNNIYFDNILITDDVEEARQVASETFDLKQIKISKGQAGFMKKFIDFSNENPWIYAVYVLALAIPIVIIFVCCCGDSQDSAATKKKTDAPTKDDPIEQPEKQNSDKDEGNLSSQDDDQDPDMEILDDEENVDDIEAEKSESDHEVVDTAVRTSPRLRKVRRE